MTTYADTRREIYAADMTAANDYYRETGDLAGYQTRALAARDECRADIRVHYCNTELETELRAALATGGRVYANLATGETVSLPSVIALYHVTDTAGAPAEPLAARIIGALTISHRTTVPVGRA